MTSGARNLPRATRDLDLLRKGDGSLEAIHADLRWSRTR